MFSLEITLDIDIGKLLVGEIPSFRHQKQKKNRFLSWESVQKAVQAFDRLLLQDQKCEDMKVEVTLPRSGDVL